MQMKKINIYALLIIILSASCSGIMMRPESAEEELNIAAGILDHDRLKFDEINAEGYYGKGYFYILSAQGIIKMHPEKVLTGKDFSGYGFVLKIIKEKKGCLSFNSSGHKINIFFRELENGDILCFAFESSTGKKTYKECIQESKNDEKR